MKFYLSGGMEYAKGHGEKWRDIFTKKLLSIGHEAENPCDEAVIYDLLGISIREFTALKSTDINKYKSYMKKIIACDIESIDQSDATILLYDESVRKGAGSISEAFYTFLSKKPLYIVTDENINNIPGWLIGLSDSIFPSFNTLLRFLSSKEIYKEG